MLEVVWIPMSEEELGIIVMESILDNMSGGMDARQATRQAVQETMNLKKEDMKVKADK